MELVEQDIIPGPDDLDAQEESPYLRRQKSVPVRRRRVSPRLRIAVFVIAVLLPVGLAGYGLATFALNSPYFVLTSPEDIVLTGSHYVSREDVWAALALPLTGKLKAGTNVFQVSLDDRRRAVENLAWARSASVTRILPHGLLVHITERVPVAYANVDGRICLVDEDGVLLEKPENAAFDFPVLYGLENLTTDDRRGRLALYREFIGQLSSDAPHSGWMISEVYLTDPEDLKALLINGQQTVQVHFGDKDFLDRFRSFLATLPEIQQANSKIDSVDLRYRNQIIVDPQTSPDMAAVSTRRGQKE
jgi:cell division protein FtsQ